MQRQARPFIRKPFTVGLALALIGALCEQCLAYGGWDYSDPQGQTRWVFWKCLDFGLPFLVLPFALFAGMIWYGAKRQPVLLKIAVALFVIWILVASSGLGVMGERGPGHLAADINGLFLASLVGLTFVYAAALVILKPYRPDAPRRNRYVSYALIGLMVMVILGFLGVPFFATGPRMEKDGRRKCEFSGLRFAGWVIQSYHFEQGESVPATIDDLARYIDERNLRCPVSQRFYVYTPNSDGTGFTLTCPTHGISHSEAWQPLNRAPRSDNNPPASGPTTRP